MSKNARSFLSYTYFCCSNCLHHVYTMASARIILYKHKELKNGEHPIIIQVVNHRKVKRISTGLSALPVNWDEDNNRFCGELPDGKARNKKLVKLEAKVENAMDWFDRHDVPFTFDRFFKKLGKPTKPIAVLALFDEIIDRLGEEQRFGYRQVFVDTRNVLARFIGKETIVMLDIDFAFLQGFEAFMRASGYSDSGIHNRMRTLRTAYNKAIAMYGVPEELYPFARTKSDTKRYTLSNLRLNTNPRALTTSEMQRIKEFRVEDFPHLERAKDYFLFSYYCHGMNFTDLARLRWRCIETGRLLFERRKTKSTTTIKLTDQIKTILEKYEHPSREPSDYIFPILDANLHKTEASIHNRIKKSRRRFNSDLKQIGKILGIDHNLTSYVSRHSYAMALRRGGYSDEIISHNLGHSNMMVTRHYLETLDNEIYDDANKVL